MTKWCPRKYWCHFLTTVVIAANSQTYMDEFSSLGQNFLLKKAMGCPSCVNTAPIPILEASVSTMIGLVKLGKTRIGAAVIASLRF